MKKNLIMYWIINCRFSVAVSNLSKILLNSSHPAARADETYYSCFWVVIVQIERGPTANQARGRL